MVRQLADAQISSFTMDAEARQVVASDEHANKDCAGCAPYLHNHARVVPPLCAQGPVLR